MSSSAARGAHALLVLLSLVLVVALGLVEWREARARRQRAGLLPSTLVVSKRSEPCVTCHANEGLGVVASWRLSRHAESSVGCLDCHEASAARIDGYDHYGERIVTAVTPRDCGRCHEAEAQDFAHSAHARAADIAPDELAALADLVGPAMADAAASCRSCHGSTVKLLLRDGGRLGPDELRPDANGQPTAALERAAELARDSNGLPLPAPDGWPNTGIGRRNVDGSLGACAACHGRHDCSAWRARRSDACVACHTGPDQPEREIVEASRHGVAYRELGLGSAALPLAGSASSSPWAAPRATGAPTWVLGRDHALAPSCATCHFGGHARGEAKASHDPTPRLAWANRRPRSVRRDTDSDGALALEANAERRRERVVDTWQDKRQRMRELCLSCHTPSTVDGALGRYDALVEQQDRSIFGPAEALVAELRARELISPRPFDEPIEWTWFELWHRAGRRARLGAAMGSAADADLREVARLLHGRLLVDARAVAGAAAASGRLADARAVEALVGELTGEATASDGLPARR